MASQGTLWQGWNGQGGIWRNWAGDRRGSIAIIFALALIPLVIIWAGIGETGKIILLFLEIGRAHV